MSFTRGGRSAAASASVISVRSALSLPEMQRGVPEVVAGEAGLDRPVRWVHAGEVPNIASLLKGGELLLTTGMGIGGRETAQRRFVKNLCDSGAAALAIEKGTHFKRIPRTVVEAAGEHDLPLICLHREVPFVEITEALHREIISRRLAVMQRGDEIHSRLLDLMLDGAAVPEILAALAEAVGNPILLEKSGYGITYHAPNRSGDREVIAGYESAVRGLAGAPAAIGEPVPVGHGDVWGRLIVLALESPLDASTSAVVERAAALIALTLQRGRQEQVLAGRERGDFLAAFLRGEIGHTEAAVRAESLGFPRDPAALLPVAALVKPPTEWAEDSGGWASAGYEEGWALVWRDVCRDIGVQTPILAGTTQRERQILMVVAIRSSGEREGIADRIATSIHEATARHFQGDGRVVLCAGAVTTTWEMLRLELGQTLAALPAVSELPPRAWHDLLRPDLDRLLWSLRECAGVRDFVNARLGPLIEYDERRGTRLVATVAALCTNGGHKSRTARSLHLERQSLYSRLERIEELLGESLEEEDTLLGLHLAVRFARHLEADTESLPKSTRLDTL